ncbi:MAG: deoxynucleoside kinase [Bacteroidota bacterium]
MATTTFPHRFIAIEGNIGAGKTTISTLLAEDAGCKLILEQFTDNPFLPFFYDNPERYAFPVELFFMTERHKQLQEELSQTDLFQHGIISDYFFIKTLLFAKNNLQDEEYRLFQRLFHILNTKAPKPDLLVYLHRSIDRLIYNINKRGRDFEEDIDPNYLLQLQYAYFDYFKATDDLPILILDIEEVDFLQSKQHYRQLIELLSASYTTGIHHFKIG